MSRVKNAQTLTRSKFLSVFSIIDLVALGINNNGNPIAKIKKAVQSRRSCGKANMVQI